MRYVFAFLLLTISVSCNKVDRLLEGVDTPLNGGMLIAFDTTELTLARGSEGNVKATLTRFGEFYGDIALSVTGAPTGITATVGAGTTAGQVTTTTLMLAVSGDAPVGIYSIILHGHANRVDDVSHLLVLTVTDAASFALSAGTPSLSIAAGGIGRTTLRVARLHSSGAVAPSLGGPTGFAATFSPTPITGDSATVTVSVAATVTPGTYPLTLRGLATGIVEQSTPLTVVVTSDPLQVIAPTTLVVRQGASVNAEVIVNNRSGGTTTLSTTGLPSNATATFTSNASVQAVNTMTVSAGPSTPAGNYTVRVRAGAGGATASAPIVLTIVPVQITGSLNPQAISILQGGPSSSSALTITRTAFDGAVNLTVEGAPVGLTVIPAPAAVTGSASTISVSASSALAAGSYSVTIRATPEGFGAGASGAATLAVTVRGAPTGTGNVVLDWSLCSEPNWVAYQDGSGPWGQLTPTAGVVRLNADSAKGGIAFVEGGNSVTVRYLTRAELTARPLDMCPPASGLKTIKGSAVFALTTESVSYQLGGASASSVAINPVFTLAGVRDGINDLIAWRPLGLGGPRALIRRDVDLPDGGDLGIVDIAGPLGFGTTTAPLTMTGYTPAERLSHNMDYLTTAACTVNSLYAGTVGSTPSMIGMPDAVQRATDFHLVTGLASTATTSRTVALTMHSLAPQIVTFPPQLGVVVVDSLASSHKRLRVTLPSVPSAYNGTATLRYASSGQTMTVSASLAYVAGSSLALAMPNLAGVSGWKANSAIAANDHGTWTFTLNGVDAAGSSCTEGHRTFAASQLGVF